MGLVTVPSKVGCYETISTWGIFNYTFPTATCTQHIQASHSPRGLDAYVYRVTTTFTRSHNMVSDGRMWLQHCLHQWGPIQKHQHNGQAVAAATLARSSCAMCKYRPSTRAIPTRNVGLYGDSQASAVGRSIVCLIINVGRTLQRGVVLKVLYY